jgi:hypothetical protein
MSYLRYTSILPSGRKSKAYVFADEKGLLNMSAFRDMTSEEEEKIEDEQDLFKHIPTDELKLLLRTRSFEEIVKILMERLEMGREESVVVCKKLIRDYKKGWW